MSGAQSLLPVDHTNGILSVLGWLSRHHRKDLLFYDSPSCIEQIPQNFVRKSRLGVNGRTCALPNQASHYLAQTTSTPADALIKRKLTEQISIYCR